MTDTKFRIMKTREELAYEIDVETEALRLGAMEQVRQLVDFRVNPKMAKNRLFAIRNACKYSRMLAVNTWLNFED